jgi:hypothetical protein
MFKQNLGFRTLMELIPTDASLIKGSHGAPPASREAGPVMIADKEILEKDSYDATEVYGVLLRRLTS